MAYAKINLEQIARAEEAGMDLFRVSYETADGKGVGEADFNSEEEAVAFIDELEAVNDQEEIDMAQDEKPASQTTPEEAEEINSDVRIQGDVSDPTEKQPSEKLDDGAGNREAPHQTKTTANDPKNEKGRAN